ncbi:MAG TPA: prolyl oligopeptidase family serine peptidase [Gemmatimonadaceae bacterium]|nr:prolyl oligopeptidase family serine peptidase [Gemmatimonadaceae bacterium]
MRRSFSFIVLGSFALLQVNRAGAQAKPTVEQFMSPSSPLELVSAHKADRVAWISYEKGMRNVYTAAAPSFTPVRLTRNLQDDGIDVTDVQISDDGTLITFVRGYDPNRAGWIANPSHDPAGGVRAIWAVRSTGGAPWKVVDGGAPELSPDGRMVAYVKDGQIYRSYTRPAATRDSIDLGLKPYIKAWGTQRNPRWSPDGSRLAFVTMRGNHSFIAVYNVNTREVSYLTPSVDFDDAPAWSPDGREIVFTRRPGLPFGQQGQVSSNSIGNPSGPASGTGASRGPCANAPMPGQGSFGQQQQQRPANDSARAKEPPGLCRATFTGGHTLSIMIATASTGASRELWHNTPNDSVFNGINVLVWANGSVIFPLAPASDEWERYYSLSVTTENPTPVMLTTTNGMIENATSAALSKDGSTLFYCTNAGDIERRHIWAVPVSGGTPRQVTTGSGIETHPQPLASGKQIAVLYYDARTPASVALAPVSGGAAQKFFPTLGKEFPTDAHVTPEVVIVKSPDGLEIHNQLFLPKDLKPGERRPALIFVHGGPVRQMLPGYHYMQFYAWAYGYNQYLASQGYVVLSVNYRSGVGYGRAFRTAPNTGGRGNSEYQDVLAAGKWLQQRHDVDPARIGIWGLSYGGVLTAQALARNSDLFVAGVDMAGVHLWGSSLDSAAVSYRSSAIGAIDGWKSPVFLVHGDDDRNVDFAQTVGLVQLLRARNVYYELQVIPDDLHESMFHRNWMDTWNRSTAFLRKHVWDKATTATSSQSR